MDQASRCWIWDKRNNHHVVRSSANLQGSATTTNSSYDESSWEEQAFAEDAAGGPEGCIWPPRCYSCSFCRRDFRSAQALGGHMNVHRRDRARLKQGAAQTSQVCSSLVCNPNPIPVNFDLLLSPRSDSRVSPVPPIQTKSRDERSFPAAPYFNSNVQNQHKRSRFSSPKSRSKCNEGRHVHKSDPAHETDDEEENNSREVVDSSGGRRRNNRTSDSGKPDLSVTLSLFVYHSHTTPPPSISCEHNEEDVSCKRRRTASPTVFTSKESSTSTKERHHIQTNVLSLGPFNDLDLELRIGQPPAMK